LAAQVKPAAATLADGQTYNWATAGAAAPAAESAAAARTKAEVALVAAVTTLAGAAAQAQSFPAPLVGCRALLRATASCMKTAAAQ